MLALEPFAAGAVVLAPVAALLVRYVLLWFDRGGEAREGLKEASSEVVSAARDLQSTSALEQDGLLDEIRNTRPELADQLERQRERDRVQVDKAAAAAQAAAVQVGTATAQAAHREPWWKWALVGFAVPVVVAGVGAIGPLLADDPVPDCVGYVDQLRQLAESRSWDVAGIDFDSLDEASGHLADRCGSSQEFFEAFPTFMPNEPVDESSSATNALVTNP